MEYVIVDFPERREVFMGGVSQGNNLNDSGGHRILRVDPPSQLVDVNGTTPVLPKHIAFTKKV